MSRNYGLHEKLNDFLKSLNMIDNQDLEREFNKTQIKYGLT